MRIGICYLDDSIASIMTAAPNKQGKIVLPSNLINDGSDLPSI
jgi:hypothetical protein